MARRPSRRGGFRLWWLGAGLGALLLIAVALSAAAYLWLRTSLPVTDGEVKVAGLSVPVEIVRDRHAIPHIFAKSDLDAFFAIGFVHAQDRLWQMEFQRRVAAGRLSEIFGERTLSIDKFIRTMGIPQAAAETARRIAPETRAAYDAYAAGVNAFLATRGGALPPEFILLGVEPEPWRVEDSLGWAKMMAWDLGGNAWDEALRARLAGTLTPAEMTALWPEYPVDGPIAIDSKTAIHQALGKALATVFPPRPPDGIGSNNWVLAGARTTSGKPLLANDPHLGLSTPSLWYLAHLNAPGLDVIGATLPGIPAPVLGRNQRIAWGFTNTNPDVQDLFFERVDPEQPTHYLTPDGSLPFVERTEVIKIDGREDLTLAVRETRHGPVVSDLIEASETVVPKDHVVAFAWTALQPDDTTAQAGINVIRARGWSEFIDVLEDFAVPQQNIVYADVDGNIGLMVPGRVPIRRSDIGWLPADGASGQGDWIDTIPYDALPRLYNPPSGYIVTANNRIVPPDYPYFLTRDWALPYRAQRIEQLITAREQHDMASMAAMQRDQKSLGAVKLVPLLVQLAKTEDSGAKAAIDRLKAFDGEMAAGKVEPLIYMAWLRELMRSLFADELKDAFEEYWSIRLAPIEAVLTTHQSLCDDKTTDATEDCGTIVGLALERALADLRQRFGDDVEAWRWGDAHAVNGRHRVLGEVPLLGPMFEVHLPNGGEKETINAGGVTPSDPVNPFGQIHGPGYRAIYDLAELDRSVFIQSTGQSGNPMSPYYKSFAELWRDGGYVPMITARERIEADKLGTLILAPR